MKSVLHGVVYMRILDTYEDHSELLVWYPKLKCFVDKLGKYKCDQAVINKSLKHGYIIRIGFIHGLTKPRI